MSLAIDFYACLGNLNEIKRVYDLGQRTYIWAVDKAIEMNHIEVADWLSQHGYLPTNLITEHNWLASHPDRLHVGPRDTGHEPTVLHA